MLVKYNWNDLGKRETQLPLVKVFRQFIRNFTIDSKETGVGPLKLYSSQLLALEEIAAGVKQDLRHFTILKARQMGMSTLFLAIDIFWLIMFPGTQGALVIDDEGNRDQFKNIITRYLENLPKELRVRVRSHNRNMLSLANGSVLHYLIAGTKKKGSFGQGRGLNFVHATELSRYGDAEAWASFVSALAEENANRLYLYESTARGYNLFYEIWEEAVDSVEKVALFLGWWTKETYRVKRDSRLYKSMMQSDYTPDEIEKIQRVKDLYGIEIDDEQVAWYRAKARELMSGDQGYVEQEFPWTAEDAFRLTGKLFFPYKSTSLLLKRAQELPFRGYRYHTGDTFDTLQTEQVKTVKECELRVWEEPSQFGIYSVGADPAYGTSIDDNTWNDRFAITVLRGYADKVVQVAEFAADNLAPYQFAWVIAHLCGWYRNTRLVLEINGPGAATLTELRKVQRELTMGHLAKTAREKGIHATLDNMSHYLYHRQDSLGAGYALHFKSSPESKGHLMRRAKDAILLNSADLRSVPMLQEMGKIVDQGGFIGAEGRAKDDRTLAYALAYRGYDDWLRSSLSANKDTYAVVREREKRAAERGKTTTMASYILQDHFRRATAIRNQGPPPGEWQFPLKDKMRAM